jgi:hypothetical protein
MIRLIDGQYVQTLMRRSKQESSSGNKDLKERLVPCPEQKNAHGAGKLRADSRFLWPIRKAPIGQAYG